MQSLLNRGDFSTQKTSALEQGPTEKIQEYFSEAELCGMRMEEI